VELSAQQKKFFELFGYLHFPGLLNDSIGWITDEFEAVWANCKTVSHTGEKRTMFPGNFICQTPKLAALMDDPRIHGICEGLMGPDYQYAGGDGNFYSGDTGWHSDLMPNCGFYKHCLHVKIAFYLDPVARDTGALRVVPGSHLAGDRFTESMMDFMKTSGLAGKDIPSLALETKPGDLVLFTHNLKHASFGGSKRRRMFVMNMQAYPHTPGAHEEVKAEWTYYASVGVKKMHSGLIMDTASPNRLKHLQPLCELVQPILDEYHAKKEKETLQPA
jgi:hypothetical protein